MGGKKKKKAPVKTKGSRANKKTVDKYRQKIVEDKTFGLKARCSPDSSWMSFISAPTLTWVPHVSLVAE